MKTTHHFTFLLLFLSSALFWGCPRVNNEPIVTLDKEFLSYFAFPEGTWWVYKEVNTGKKDSLYVISYEIRIEGPRPLGYKHEALGMNIKTSDSMRRYGVTPFPKENYVINSVEELFPSGINSTSYDRLYYPISIENLDLFPIQNIDSMMLQNGNLYLNILSAVKDSMTNRDPYIRSEHYAKGVGLIRREYWNGEVWELEKYHIK